jgi:hypothetical protein
MLWRIYKYLLNIVLTVSCKFASVSQGTRSLAYWILHAVVGSSPAEEQHMTWRNDFCCDGRPSGQFDVHTLKRIWALPSTTPLVAPANPYVQWQDEAAINKFIEMDMSYTRVLHIQVAYRVPHKWRHAFYVTRPSLCAGITCYVTVITHGRCYARA